MFGGPGDCEVNSNWNSNRSNNRETVMKPVYQTRFGYPEGNCHAAALASVLEIPIEEIPNFGIDDDWYDHFVRYMVSHHALQPIDFIIPKNVVHDLWVPQGYHLINGTSSRGLEHSVVGFMGEMEFDPHPDDSGLEEIDSYTIFAVLGPRMIIS